jgi:hypothetical protein
MGFLKNLFPSKRELKTEKQPDNARLIFLLNIYSEHNSDKNSRLILDELKNGNNFLIVPIIDEHNKAIGEQANILTLASSFDLDGLKVLGAFTDEASLMRWANAPTPYYATKSGLLLDFARDNKVNKVVINMGSPNCYIVEKQKSLATIPRKADSRFAIGELRRPIRGRHEDRIVANFAALVNVLEAYQFAHYIDDEYLPTIGVKLKVYSDHGREAAICAVTDTLTDEFARIKLNVVFFDNEEAYQIVSKIDRARFYLKADMMTNK